MIPDPSFPSQENMARAMAQADMFVQQTRMQAQSQMMQQQAAFTGGVGGGQPGLMGYAGQALAGFGGGFMAQMQQSAAAAASRMAMVPAAGAAMGIPSFQQFGNVIEGARYSQPRMTLSGMVTAAYAPLSLFPQAGGAFNMEQRVVREMAQEELGRRFTQIGRAGLYQTANALGKGVPGFFMRRSGLEVSWLGEMEAERSAQRSLGYLRGGPYEAASGMGVNREFFTRGAGREYMREIMQGAGDLQRATGMNAQQIQLLTDVAQSSIDPTRGANYQARGGRGMQEMGREVSEIRRTMAQMSQSMQMAPEEAARFFSQLNKVMKVTDAGLKSFQEQNRQMALTGPFSEMQVAQVRMQGMQMGRQLYMGGGAFGNMAMQMANQVAEQRRSGIIRDETLLREGGGLDQEAMARMMMRRLQQQAQAVQSGNFNTALTLAGNTPQAFSALMSGGAGYFQTQAALASTIIRNPFALQRAWSDPGAMRQITAMAPGIAFQQAQQLTALMPMWNNEQRTTMRIESFGRQLGLDVSNAVGFNEARVRYEEIQDVQNRIGGALQGLGFDRGPGKKPGTYSAGMLRRHSSTLFGFMQMSGATAEEAARSFHVIRSVPEKWAEYAKASPTERMQMMEEQYVQERVSSVMGDRASAGEAMKATAVGILKGASTWVGYNQERVLQNTGRAIEKIAEREGINYVAASQRLLGPLAEARDIVDIRTGERDIGTAFIPGVGLAVAGYKALTDSSFLKDEYVFRSERVLGRAGGLLEVQTERFNIDQKKFRTYMDSHHPGWRKNWNRARIQKEFPAIMREYVKKMDIKGTLETAELRPGTEQYRQLEERLKGEFAPDEGRLAEERRVRLGMALNRAPGISGVLAEYGITAGGRWEDVEKKIMNLENEQTAVANPALRSLVSVAALESKGTYNMELSKLEGMDIGGMRKWFKHWAATEGGDALGGKKWSNLTMKDMEGIAQGMSDDDKKKLFNDLSLQAIERSQRMLENVPLGDINRPSYVVVKGTMPGVTLVPAGATKETGTGT